MKTDRFVFDTNTLISAVILPKSTAALALQKAENSGFLFTSTDTFAELESVLARPKFDRYIPLSIRQGFLQRYKALALFLTISQPVTDCRDPKDNKFLELALSADAHYLITGDNDLLELHPYRNTQIISASQFLVLT
ncbi:putative toxin-antitoxin system toxin component, PIN family [Fibrella aestuarina]|uniref:putative toxin-antitoxin system toxin component, PIN family n=1 Tax=Fibrella aestuarina TaxID=651143 RepID=UPI00059CF87B|nr:putative toxin-antitoxin system toxin component, PIN family [Fibrella aestuarina]